MISFQITKKLHDKKIIASLKYKYILQHCLVPKVIEAILKSSFSIDSIETFKTKKIKKWLETYDFNAFMWAHTKEGHEFWKHHYESMEYEVEENIVELNK